MRVVIAAELGRLREGLRTMLVSLLDLEALTVVDNRPWALEAMRSEQPDLIILDSCLFDEDTATFVCAVKQERKDVRCIVVAERLGQFQPLLDAGTDKVLLKGFSAAEVEAPVGIIDLAPTFCQIAGAEVPDSMESQPLPRTQAEAEEQGREVVFTQYESHTPDAHIIMNAARDERYTCIQYEGTATYEGTEGELYDNWPSFFRGVSRRFNYQWTMNMTGGVLQECCQRV
jgi:DNA-binding NarL/FixJ family response regulator